MLPALGVLYLATLGVLASARIYPTYPVASTVLSAGRVNTILWKDDGKWPSLYEMGPVTISLYVGQVSLLRTVCICVAIVQRHARRAWSARFPQQPRRG